MYVRVHATNLSIFTGQILGVGKQKESSAKH